ncbi:Spo0E family sporulation regulatory protein-aspartic acid phosphatase [Sporosarcina siberiensis]|uniref:Spo0E family sporulation regulatory protein-aspartic acid phosphatase n=1 Tax=Sporosarcina siberiensis TaxID=1365606 RepID=A0ABW4SB62_9BACL
MSTINCLNSLLKNIESKQKDMYFKANQFGFTHPVVVACSKELDDLLNCYQGIVGTRKIS